MLKNKYIIILGAVRFDGADPSTSVSIARQLAKNNFVYYIDYPVTWKDYFKGRNTPHIRTRRPYFSLSSEGVISSDIPNLKIIICPPLVSINFLPEGIVYRAFLKINEMIIRRRIRKVIRKNKIKEFIYINSFNFHYPNVSDTLNPALTIYHSVDPMIIPYDMKHGIVSETDLVRRSDLVICTSRQLYEEKKLINKSTFFIPNATDINHISKALNQNTPVNEHVADLKKPIIGYTGSIERRLDYTLLKEVINNNKDKSFVFAGPTSQEYIPEWFIDTPNIFLTGHIPYNDIPGLIKGFDVAIIPFKKDAVSQTIFPLKLFEYLGAGKPVIATNFNPDLEEFTQGMVSFCENAKSFSLAIKNALENDNSDLKKSRIAVASQNTWEKRGNDIAELITISLDNR